MSDEPKEPDLTDGALPKLPPDPPKNKGGRPRKPIDFGMIEKLSAICLPQEAIAWIVGVSEDTLRRRGRRFREAVARGRAKSGLLILKKQFEIAQDDKSRREQTQMLIHLGKNYVGQKDRVQVDGDEAMKQLADALGVKPEDLPR